MLLAAQPLASQPNPHRRLYVEPFATQEGAETLQARARPSPELN